MQRTDSKMRISMVRGTINEKIVDLRMFPRFFALEIPVLDAISKAIKNGRKRGIMGVKSGENKNLLIWKVSEDNIEVGDTVEFSTSGKYNPGFHSTETYTGKVEWISYGRYCIKTDSGTAVVPLTHIGKKL